MCKFFNTIIEGGGGYGRLAPRNTSILATYRPNLMALFDRIPVCFSLFAMVASAVKLRRTTRRVLYVSAQLASIKLCDVAALFNCQLLSEVTQLIESGYLCLSPVWQLNPFPNDNDSTF